MGLFTLARWLGPWAGSHKSPAVPARDEDLDGIRVRIYGRRDRSTFLIAPGLHYAGPDDPRMDRFCRILAAAGHLVVAPFIPDYLALEPNARAIRDYKLVIFGGYADFRETVGFCLTGSVLSGRAAIRDPLNQPVVMLNLLEHLD